MRNWLFYLAVSVLCCWTAPLRGADALKFGPAPAWVVPHDKNPAAPTNAEAPVAILLNDQQIHLERGKVSQYNEVAIKIQNAQGLSAGNISIPWQPATDTVTVNKLLLRRGEQVIDILASGQSFTTIRRETNLEAATLDGQLTANIQPEGVQEGDIIEMATTLERSDPVLQGHVESTFAIFAGLPIAQGRARVTWPQDMNVRTRLSNLLPKAVPTPDGGKQVLELALRGIEPPSPPKEAPPRFGLGYYAEASDYASWAEVASLMVPLFEAASAIPASGPLRAEVDRIRTQGATPEQRAGLALELVQKRIRYVALLMENGNYRPASAAETWSRRYGDCKAKTALLLGLLRELGIAARPVLVHSTIGDALPQRLPMLGAFDHVIVEATVGGRSFFLDGTRSGDRNLSDAETPYFAWGLPVAANASLIRILPPPLTEPTIETVMEIDAREGARAPAPAKVEVTLRGNEAVQLNMLMSLATAAQRDEILRAYWKSSHGFVTVQSTHARFNADSGQYRLTMSGTAKLDWDGGFRIPNATLAFKANFERSPGPGQDAPIAIDYPNYALSRTTLRFPAGFFAQARPAVDPIDEKLAGVEYRRAATVAGDTLVVETSERSFVPEVPYAEALQAEERLRTLWDDDVLVRMPSSYRPTKKDVADLDAQRPRSSDEYLERGNHFLDNGQYDKAIADFTTAIELNPASASAFAARGITHVWKKDYPAAEKDLAKAEQHQPGGIVVLRARGLMAKQLGQWAKAVEAFSKALEARPGDAFSHGHRGLAYMELDERQKALSDFDSALRLDPSWSDLRLSKANIYLEMGDRDAAIREAGQLVSLNSDSDYALVTAARLYSRLGMRKEMDDAYERALALGPHPNVFLNRADTRLQSDKQGRRADIEAAIKLEPDNIETLVTMAELLAEEGDFPSALKHYDQVLQKEKGTWLLIARAVVAYRAGHRVEAEATLAAQRSKLTSATELNNLCWTKGTAGILLDSALEDCRESLRLEPRNGATMDSLALVLLRLGRIDEAIAQYDKAIELGTKASSYMGRALAHARKGDKVRAQADRAKALKSDARIEDWFASYGLELEPPS